MAFALALTGCQVHTQVSVDAATGGRGVVRVSVSLDGAALVAIGGPKALAAQLQDADLEAAGWTVTGPSPGPGSSTVVTARHPYDSPAQASALVGELAGSGAAASRPFRLSLSERHSFWRTDTSLTGRVDLTCGLGCFGDSRLTTALGFPTGVNPGSLAAAAGVRPDQVFTFSVGARLPGSVVSSNAVSRPGGTLVWVPRLGQSSELAAVTRTWNWGRIVALTVAGGVVVLGGLGFVLYWWWWRRRRRRIGRPRGGLHRKPRGTASEAVAPHP